MAAEDHCMLYMTAPDRETARTVCDTLLRERLVACANLFDVDSIYWWKGELERDAETVAVMKTRTALAERAIERAKELHPYEVPCLVAYPMAAGSADYLAWIDAETTA